MPDWETLGAVDPRALIDARLQFHWATQVAAAVGKQLLPRQPDFSEQSLEWLAEPRGLAQGVVASATPFRSAIRLGRPALMLLDAGGGTLREMPLDGRTLDEAYAWMASEVEALLERPLDQPLERPEGLPDHPVASGATFSLAGSAAPPEIERYYAGADRLLRALRDANPEASPVRCWPHHFDLATLLRLDPDADPEEGAIDRRGIEPGRRHLRRALLLHPPLAPPRRRAAEAGRRPLAHGGLDRRGPRSFGTYRRRFERCATRSDRKVFGLGGGGLPPPAGRMKAILPH
jgi:hypothetical protein